MTVNLRAKRSQNGVAGRRPRGEREFGWRTRRLVRAGSESAVQAAVAGPSRVAPPTSSTGSGASPARGRATPPAPQDRALYSCACGFVFSQDVSTSVSCPHCGGTQAW